MILKDLVFCCHYSCYSFQNVTVIMALFKPQNTGSSFFGVYIMCVIRDIELSNTFVISRKFVYFSRMIRQIGNYLSLFNIIFHEKKLFI
jgi:hypothetical protein